MAAPIIIPSVTPTGTGVTGATYWNRLADTLGIYLPTAVSSVAAGGDPNRVVLADELRDDEVDYPFLPTWLYVRPTILDGAVQRRILNEPGTGYQGNQALLTLSRPFDSALAEGRSVVATHPLPMLRHMGIKGLRECTNEALDLIWIEAVLSVTGNGTYEYDLAPTPYLQFDWQLRGVYDTVWQGGPVVPELSSGDAHIVTNGVTRTLVTDSLYDAATTFYLHILVRASTFVYDGSSWSYTTTPGLQTESYQAAAPEQWVVAFGMVKALQQLTKLAMLDRRLDKQGRALLLTDLARQRAGWARAARTIKLQQFPKPLPVPSTPLIEAPLAPAWN